MPIALGMQTALAVQAMSETSLAGVRRASPLVLRRPDLPARVRIWEVAPRDGLQNEPAILPAAVKVELVTRLVDAGLATVETTSFVNPTWVPQLADAEEVFALLAPLRAARTIAGTDDASGDAGGLRLPALVPNLAGLDRARSCGVRDVCVFASATETFARKNLNRSRDDALEMIAPVVAEAQADSIGVRAYVSMCFGDPWEGAVSEADVVSVCERLLGMGVDEVSLGDTIGVATSGQVVHLLDALARAGVPAGRLAVHFHDTYGQALVNTLTALSWGVTTVDSSAGGIGGCPFAESATGNLATEDLCWALAGAGVETGVDLGRLVETSRWVAGQLGRPSPSKVVQALSGPTATETGTDTGARSETGTGAGSETETGTGSETGTGTETETAAGGPR